MKNIVSVIVMTVFSSAIITAQEKPESKVKFKLTADVVSAYIFRGVLATPRPNPNFQPTLAVGIGNLEIGAWGSTSFVGDYREMDLYATYTAGPLGITATDYFFSNQGPNFGDMTAPPRYFNYKSETTGHIYELALSYTGPESFPISLMAGTFLYGNDKKYTGDTINLGFDLKKNAYSTYIEVGYLWAGTLKTFIGATPWNGYYGAGYGVVNGFNIVNVGASMSKSIPITEKYALPIKAALYFNPQAESTCLVFGITF